MTFTNHLFRRLALICASLALMTAPAMAAVVQSTGTAVTRIDAAADFETTASLGASFVEDGLSFARVNVTTNNNGCGFAGCSSFFTGVSGNYLFGFGRGHLSISAATDQVFEVLEFTFGWNATHRIGWQALLDGATVAQGGADGIAGGTVLNFSGNFDTLLFTSNTFFTPRLNGFLNTPAIDSVRAQFLPSVVPVPASLPLMLTALLGGGWLIRRKRG